MQRQRLILVSLVVCGLTVSSGCSRSQPTPPSAVVPDATGAAPGGPNAADQKAADQKAADQKRPEQPSAIVAQPPAQDDAKCIEALQAREATIERDEDGLVIKVEVTEGAVTDILRKLTGLPRLRHLSLAGSQVEDDDLQVVGKLSQLAELDLFDTKIGDSGLTHLAALSQLRRLDLSGTQVSDAGLATLARFPELRQLDLGWTELTGKSLDELARTERLESLDLSWTRVSDEQLAGLVKLKQLRQLTLADTDVTDAGFEQLREAMPEVEIVARDVVAQAVRSGRTLDYRLAGAGVGDLYRIAAGDYDTAWDEFLRRYGSATSEQEREEVATTAPDPRPFAERMLKLAEDNPDHAAAMSALTWVVGADERFVQDLQQQATELLLEKYADDPRLGDTCLQLSQVTNAATQSLLKQIHKQTSDENVRGKAAFALARSLSTLADEARQVQQMDEIARNQTIQLQGIPTVGRFLDAKPAALLEEAEVLLTEIEQQLGQIQVGDTTLGELAKARLFELRSLSVGNEAPEIVGRDVDDQPLTLSEHRGKIVVLTFWGNWCGPCRAMFPHERELAARLKDEPFVMLGVNSDRDRDLARQVMLEENLTWRSWWDGGSTQGPISQAWRVERWPTIYVFDQRGIIRYKDVRGEMLDRAVDSLLAEMKQGELPAAEPPAAEPPPTDEPT